METAQLAGVEEYLHSSYEPDAEYANGLIILRSMPQKPHSKMQGFVYRTLYALAQPLGYEVWLEQRLRTRTGPAHYRVPDVCITLGEPDEHIFTTAPHLCVEILSPDDSAFELRMKIEEYLAMGVAYVWVIDPLALTGEVYSSAEIQRVRDSSLRAGTMEINLRNLA